MHDFKVVVQYKILSLKYENIVRVILKCFSKLADSDKCDFRDSTEYELNDGQTVKAPVESAGIDKKSVKIAFVNNKDRKESKWR